MEKGEDVLIVFDDLSKHAIAYRTMSLLLKRPPGREAYPGDVFYLHSRLLERACCLNQDYGGGSITALPIVETQAGDISAYIPTNVISITDGQIFMMANLFNAGQRPAVDPGLSVSRVGSAAQIKAIKQVSGGLKLQLAQYNELAAFAQFGSDLDKVTAGILENGKKIVALLKQKQYQPLDQIAQSLIFFAIHHNFIKDIKSEQILAYQNHLLTYFKKQGALFVTKLTQNQEFTTSLTTSCHQHMSKLTQQFLKLYPKEAS